jgi:ribonucleoside-diphosphate reductase subunit M2
MDAPADTDTAAVFPDYFPTLFTEAAKAEDADADADADGDAEEDTSDEPLLSEEEEGQRFVLFPLRYPQVFAMGKKAVASFWTVEEVDLAPDLKDWRALTRDEKEFLVVVLSFFAASDGIVNENLALNFYDEVKNAEARYFYGIQLAVETIHSEMYSTLIDRLLEEDAKKLKHALRALHTIPCVRDKGKWALKWANKGKAAFGKRLVAFACVEGIFFSASFCAIFWMKKRGLMPGLAFSNELISRDEGLHCDFACLLFSMLKHKPSADTVSAIVQDAVKCELQFVEEALHVGLIGMNAALMGQYVKFVADRLLTQLGVPKVYGVPNPFDWMEMISIEGKTNFFEKRVGEYAKAGVQVATGAEAGAGKDAGAHGAFSLDEDF